MAKTSLAPHTRFPHIPAKAKVQADSACAACPMATVAGHETCAAFGPDQAATDDEKINLKDLQNWQWQLERRELDGSGLLGMKGNAWYYYNARDSLNYADFSVWDISSVSGTTIVLHTDGDPRAIFLYSWRMGNEIGQWINGFQRTGCVQPGDIIRFSSNSVITNTCWPVVLQVLACDPGAGTLTLRVDKIMTAALTSTDEEAVTASVYHQEGNRENWQYVIRPDYFYGTQKSVTWQLADLPENGIIQIESVAVMHPGGFDPLNPTWTLEAKRIDTGAWETAPLYLKRLFTLPDKAYVALKDSKPAESSVTETLDDLTATYNAFRATYWAKADPTASSCSAVGYARCKWSMPDETASVGNYAAANGTGVNDAGQHYYCAKGQIDVNTPVDNFPEGDPDGYDDSIDHSMVQASGVARFPRTGANAGLCDLYNCCDQYQAAENDSGRDAPFNESLHAGNFFKELWGAVNHRLLQPIPGVQYYQPQRIQHTSLAWLVGYWPLATPVGQHEQATFVGNGLWGDKATRTDEDGNEYLEQVQGDIEKLLPHALPMAADTVPDPGHFAADVLGFPTKRDILDASTTQNDDALERIGYRVRRDDGTLQGRGISQSTVAVLPQNVIVPNIDPSGATTQTRAAGKFEKKTGEASVLTIFPLRQETKTETSLGSRTVHAVADNGDGTSTVSFENVQHQWSKIDNEGVPGTSYDRILTFSAGGGDPICPPDFMQVDSFHETQKSLGSHMGGLVPGDAIAFGSGDTLRLYVVKDVAPFGGDPAATWGNRKVTVSFTCEGYWQVPADKSGNIIPPTTGFLVAYSDLSGALTPVDSIDRPASIPAGSYWIYQGRAILFSDLETDGRGIDISYGLDSDDPQVDYADTFTCHPTFTATTTELVSEYSTASAVTITADGTTITPTVDTSGTYVVVTVSTAEAAKVIAVVMDFAEESAPPLDGYSLGENYLSLAKHMDTVTFYTDSDAVGFGDGDTVDCIAQAAVMLPGAGIEWTAYGVDSWATVPDAVVRHGTGQFLIPEDFVTARTGPYCYRATGVKYLDHRGIVPASLYNKTADAIDSVKWVRTQMEAFGTGTFEFSETFNRIWNFEQPDPEGAPCTIVLGNPIDGSGVNTGPANTFFQSGDYAPAGDGRSSYTTIVGLKFSSNQVGIPDALKRFPDGITILEAWADVTGAGVTSTKTYHEDEQRDCAGDLISAEVAPDPDTSTTGLELTFIGFPTADSYVALGSFPVTDPNKSNVVDISDVIQIMLDNRSAGTYPFGYGVIYTGGISTSDLAGLIPDHGALRSWTACSGTCAGMSFQEFYTQFGHTISWDTIGIGTIMLKVQYPDSTKDELIIQPRWPAFD